MEEMKVYHIGYNCYDSERQVQSLMQDPRMLLIDTRYKPWSYKPQWSRDDKHVGGCTVPGLRSQWGQRYRFAGHYLGNLNYKGGPILIAHLETGLRGLMMYLREGHPLILLCQCTHDGCHRYTIMRALKAAMPEVQFYRADGTPEQIDALHVPEQVAETTYKCLSIRPPYAQWIAQHDRFVAAGIPPKTIENREWTTRYRGPVLLHASKSFEEDAVWHWVRRIPGLYDVVPRDEDEYQKGMIIGIADLVGVVEESDDPWFCGTYGWVFANARPLKAPIPYRGALKLFDVSASVVQHVLPVLV